MEHRHAVREATLEATAELIENDGISAVSMTRVAGKAGIGRATLYKYFPDVDALLAAWHERQVTQHLAHLAAVRDEAAGTGRELQAVLEAYALTNYGRPGGEAPAFLHQNDHTAHAAQHLRGFIQELINAGAAKGVVRSDMDSGELADYCLHALGAASALSSKEAVPGLVKVVLNGLARANH